MYLEIFIGIIFRYCGKVRLYKMCLFNFDVMCYKGVFRVSKEWICCFSNIG